MAFQRKKNKPKDIGDKSVTILPPKRTQKDTQFKPGNSLGGRPKGSRNRFAEEFFDAFLEDFEEHGAQAIADCRVEDPAVYVRVAASLVPKELVVKDEESIVRKFLQQFKSVEEIREFRRQLASVTAGQSVDEGRDPSRTRS